MSKPGLAAVEPFHAPFDAPTATIRPLPCAMPSENRATHFSGMPTVPSSANTPGRIKAIMFGETIGQGELLITPFQLANLAATIANRGHYYTPHLVRSIWSTREEVEKLEFERHESTIDPSHFDVVIDGMQAVVEESNVRYYSKLDSIIICGKTGTVQNPHGSDHSVFIAFAPKDNPQIAISVYVENGVWGSRYAAPIASLIIEKYLNGEIAPRRIAVEERMRDANLLNPNQPK